ncbi:MAG: tryptophan--tRNA ligase [Ignavibacteria bacterium]
MIKKRILSGMRPTGKLHLGNYVGALENWIKLQDEFDSFHLIADYHMLTTDLDTSSINQNTIEMVTDWLATGLDPVKSPFFRQSKIKEHAELNLLFTMLITTARLERNPTLKDQVRDLHIESMTYGHLGYPVLQSADILLYKGEVVPVGEDQVPHVEITREIARKFNLQYGAVFPEPEARLTKFARLPGLDGVAKMSKSLNNAVFLSDDADTVKAKMKKTITDPLKIRRGDPGRPEVCIVYMYQQKFNTVEHVSEIEAGCHSGVLGCVDCKLKVATCINQILEPVLIKRKYYEDNIGEVKDILADGEKRGQAAARQTMSEVHEKMNLG